MSKFKIEHSSGQNFLVIQGQKGQQISEREYYAISTGQIPGLLRAELIRKGSTFKLVYNISGYISLREFLVNPLNKQSFARLLNNILNNLKALQRAYYNYQFILMDMNAAMVNPTTQQVSFVYVPITFYESGTSLKEFLLSIIQCCSFAPGENTDYVREYIRILNAGINFSVFDLEEYIKTLNVDNQNNNQAKKCSRCGSLIQPNVNFCSSCGMKVSGIKVENANGVYDPARVVARPQQHQPQQVRQPQQVQQHQPMQQSPQAQQPQEPVVNKAPEAAPNRYSETISHSVVGSTPTVPQRKNACITRCKTGEQILITAEQFRVGKDPYNCEYCISDNSAVSRCHAVIKSVNGKWFINDLNSTNKTYVSDRAINPYMDIELCDGVSIKLANENFIFNLY